MRDNLPEIKHRQKLIWNSAAGYHRLAEHFLPATERLLDLLAVNASDRVLDIAAGSGLATIAARRRGAEVSGQDLAPVLLGEARHYARSNDFPDIVFDESDAEDLSYPASAFTVVLSNFGVIYTPRGDVAGGEMERVLAPAGRIGFSTWQTNNPLHDVPKIMAKYVSPDWLPTDTQSWGNYRDVRQFISQRYVPELECEEGQLSLIYPDAGRAWRDWGRNYGPFRVVRDRLSVEQREELDRDMTAYYRQWSGKDGKIVWPLTYLLFYGVKISNMRLLG